uniref:Adenosylhomocysteinase n=2 Tax=candidate division WOR-3 bacterium TaxID=2052148 RepID=A0A7V4AB98_UNCW3
MKKEGLKKIIWAKNSMNVLSLLEEEFKREKPFKGLKISACLHITSETANLAIALKEGGAEIRLCASNPLSTKDDIAQALREYFGIEVFARYNETKEEYYENIHKCLEIKPDITLDDGADLTATLIENFKEYGKNMIGGTEETTTGVIRLKAMEKRNELLFPVIAVNDSKTKFLFDNRYGTGQSTIDGILRATNILLAGKIFVVCGYGWCGKGVAMRAKGMGARVIITEVDPIRALEAVMDGFEVMKIEEAAKIGDIFVTVTGNKNVIDEEAILKMKDGVILANSGHFDVEINKEFLEKNSIKKERIRENVDEYTLKNGKKIYLLAEGRLVNLSAAEGHPASVMDMSFSNQALAVKFLKENGKNLEKKVYVLPEEIDRRIAILKLKTMGIEIDELKEEQRRYLESWREGT